MMFVSSFGINEKYKSGNSSVNTNNNGVTIKPVAPTHYLYAPKTIVLNQYEMVVSIREISFGLGNNFMLMASPWNGRITDGSSWGNIGNVRFGAKYALDDFSSFGVGLDYDGNNTALGAFYAIKISNYDMTLVPKISIGFKNKHSFGLVFAGEAPMNDLFSIIWEADYSNDLVVYDNSVPDETEYSNTGKLGLHGAVRKVPPKIKFLYVDLGVSGDLELYEDFGNLYGYVYLDLGVGFSLK